MLDGENWDETAMQTFAVVPVGHAVYINNQRVVHVSVKQPRDGSSTCLTQHCAPPRVSRDTAAPALTERSTPDT